MLEIGRESQDLGQAPVVRIVERVDVERGQIFLDRPVSSRSSTSSIRAVSSDALAIGVIERVERAVQHRLEHVGHPQRFAGGSGERDARCLAGRAVEVYRLRRIGQIDARRQEHRQQSAERLQHREEQQRQDDVEAGVKIGDGPAGIGVDRNEGRADPVEQRENQRAAEDAG